MIPETSTFHRDEEVVYVPTQERGIVTNQSEEFVFVRFRGRCYSAACYPEDLVRAADLPVGQPSVGDLFLRAGCWGTAGLVFAALARRIALSDVPAGGRYLAVGVGVLAVVAAMVQIWRCGSEIDRRIDEWRRRD